MCNEKAWARETVCHRGGAGLLGRHVWRPRQKQEREAKMEMVKNDGDGEERLFR